MSLALRIVIGWSIAIVVTIALWNLGFILAARRQRALEAEGLGAAAESGPHPGATPARATRVTGQHPAAVPRARGADRRRARAG